MNKYLTTIALTLLIPLCGFAENIDIRGNRTDHADPQGNPLVLPLPSSGSLTNWIVVHISEAGSESFYQIKEQDEQGRIAVQAIGGNLAMAWKVDIQAKLRDNDRSRWLMPKRSLPGMPREQVLRRLSIDSNTSMQSRSDSSIVYTVLESNPVWFIEDRPSVSGYSGTVERGRWSDQVYLSPNVRNEKWRVFAEDVKQFTVEVQFIDGFAVSQSVLSEKDLGRKFLREEFVSR